MDGSLFQAQGKAVCALCENVITGRVFRNPAGELPDDDRRYYCAECVLEMSGDVPGYSKVPKN